MMSWLTSPALFYGSLPLSLLAPIVLMWVTARYRTTGRSLNQELRADLHSPFSDIAGKLESLLKSGYDRAFLTVTFEETGYFLQYRKHIHAKGDYGIELGFPIAGWSRHFVPKLRAYCDANGIAYSEGTEVPGDPIAFLHIDFARDAGAAFRMADTIMSEVFKISIDSKYDWEFDGLNRLGELIDSPRSRPPSPSETLRRMNQEGFKTTGMYLSDAGWILLNFLCRYTGTFGLCHGLFWKLLWAAATRAPDWGTASVLIGDRNVEARTFDLVCIGLILISLAIDISPSGRRQKAAKSGRGENDLEWPGWMRRIGLVFPRRLRLPALLLATVAFWLA